jgi:hypothetical protein
VTAVYNRGKETAWFEGISRKPSDGLEPSTPSLPCGLEPLPWLPTVADRLV